MSAKPMRTKCRLPLRLRGLRSTVLLMRKSSGSMACSTSFMFALDGETPILESTRAA